MKPSLANALWSAASRARSSPTAVAMMQIRGCAPARASSAASWYDGPGRRFEGIGPSGWNPMEVAMMVGLTRRHVRNERTSGLTMCSGRAPAISRHRSSAIVRVWLDSVS